MRSSITARAISAPRPRPSSAPSAQLDADIDVAVTSEPEFVRRADRIVLPGVGAFEDCMNGLAAIKGMRETLEERVIKGGVPFLGICVGMQLMATEGREKGITPASAGSQAPSSASSPPAASRCRIWAGTPSPSRRPHAILDGIPDGDDGLHAYFVHSYHLATDEPSTLIATADYGQAVTACVGRDNLFGTQFHPKRARPSA